MAPWMIQQCWQCCHGSTLDQRCDSQICGARFMYGIVSGLQEAKNTVTIKHPPNVISWRTFDSEKGIAAPPVHVYNLRNSLGEITWVPWGSVPSLFPGNDLSCRFPPHWRALQCGWTVWQSSPSHDQMASPQWHVSSSPWWVTTEMSTA